MFKDIQKGWREIINKARELTLGCGRVLVAGSGGVDSSTLIAVCCAALGPDKVVVFYRDIRSNRKHLEDLRELQKNLGFCLFVYDLNQIYDSIVAQTKKQAIALGFDWLDENSEDAKEAGFENSYASLKSTLTTPIASFLSKLIDSGRGRIMGTGNGEEDGLLRYFDKRGDGAVDNNLFDGLTKAEVRQLAFYSGKVPMSIITKKPSADLKANGDDHNDESELTAWAKELGYDMEVSYGASDGSNEGNIAWAWKEDVKYGLITGRLRKLSGDQLLLAGYTEKERDLIGFLKSVEKSTRHKVAPIPGFKREELIRLGIVDE